MDDETRKEAEKAETALEGISNDVYIGQEEVIKYYRKYPLSSIYASLIRTLSGKPGFLNREDRMGNEKNMKEEVRRAGLAARKITSQDTDTIKFEKVEGETVHSRLKESGGEEAEELGAEIREFLERLHSNDAALLDTRLSNFLIGEELYSIDHEYGCRDAGRFLFFVDCMTVVASARQEKNFDAFMKGFQPGLVQRIVSIPAALTYAVLSRDLERLKHTLVNTF